VFAKNKKMKLSVKEIESEIEGLVKLEHSCSENDIPDLQRVLLVSSSKFIESQWGIYSLWLANDFDVKSGEAKKTGEILEYSMMVIKYCPFCGFKLSNATKNK
jgi:hypothetical protein